VYIYVMQSHPPLEILIPRSEVHACQPLVPKSQVLPSHDLCRRCAIAPAEPYPLVMGVISDCAISRLTCRSDPDIRSNHLRFPFGRSTGVVPADLQSSRNKYPRRGSCSAAARSQIADCSPTPKHRDTWQIRSTSSCSSDVSSRDTWPATCCSDVMSSAPPMVSPYISCKHMMRLALSVTSVCTCTVITHLPVKWEWLEQLWMVVHERPEVALISEPHRLGRVVLRLVPRLCDEVWRGT
jgi:hypothetical protein